MITHCLMWWDCFHQQLMKMRRSNLTNMAVVVAAAAAAVDAVDVDVGVVVVVGDDGAVVGGDRMLL